jgi:hypothetical protein
LLGAQSVGGKSCQFESKFGDLSRHALQISSFDHLAPRRTARLT